MAWKSVLAVLGLIELALRLVFILACIVLLATAALTIIPLMMFALLDKPLPDMDDLLTVQLWRKI